MAKKNKPRYPNVTFTVTTSRRLDLFIRTMDSFMKNCQDLDLISRWVLSDDRSCNNDITEMQKKYPFFEIYKSPAPGQASSLNNLFGKVRTEWIFHCEDDWLFTKKGHFIKEMLDIAFSDERIRNIVLRFWKCIYVKHGDLEYRVHNYHYHCQEGGIFNADMRWYGYSLNPGLQHKPTIDMLGAYDDRGCEKTGFAARFWDRPQAQKYYELGLKRCNLNTNYIKHIGDRGKSAYNKKG